MRTLPVFVMNTRFCTTIFALLCASATAEESPSPQSQFYYNGTPDNENAYIAHAGGVQPFMYSNCKEAVKDSLQRGFRFIELDLLKTDDGRLVAAHDRAMFSILTGSLCGLPGRFLSFDAAQLTIAGKYTVLTGQDIYALMQQHPEMILVTDKVTDYELLRAEIPLPERMIVECFSVQDIKRARAAGFVHTALCVQTPQHLQLAQQLGLQMLTVSLEDVLFDADMLPLLEALHRQGVCIMAYGFAADYPCLLENWLGRYFSKFYINRPASFRCKTAVQQ